MNATNMLKTVLGFRTDSIVMQTGMEWLIAIQPGDKDKEIVGAGKVPATCFELGYINKATLRNFLTEANPTKAELKIGDSYLSFEYLESGDLMIDYGRYIHNGELQLIDDKQLKAAGVPAFKLRLLEVINTAITE